MLSSTPPSDNNRNKKSIIFLNCEICLWLAFFVLNSVITPRIIRNYVPQGDVSSRVQRKKIKAKMNTRAVFARLVKGNLTLSSSPESRLGSLLGSLSES